MSIKIVERNINLFTSKGLRGIAGSLTPIQNVALAYGMGLLPNFGDSHLVNRVPNMLSVGRDLQILCEKQGVSLLDVKLPDAVEIKVKDGKLVLAFKEEKNPFDGFSNFLTACGFWRPQRAEEPVFPGRVAAITGSSSLTQDMINKVLGVKSPFLWLPDFNLPPLKLS